MIMLKQLLTTAGLCILCSSALAEGQNYTLTIEGKTYDAAPGEIVHAKLKSGVDVDIAFERKAFGTFNNDGFSFEYPSAMAVAETEIDKGITQFALSTAVGSMVIVQRYADNHAEKLVEFLLDEMVKDDKNLGAKIDKQPVTMKLKDGKVLKGMKVIVTQGSDEARLEAYGADIGSGGLVAISRITAEDMGKDEPMIDRFWESLSIDN